MTLSRVRFVVAAWAAVSAGGLLTAQTQYQNQKCVGTPVPLCQNQCGCPVINNGNDLCSGAMPPFGQTYNTWYYCASVPQETCTSPAKSCGGIVFNCKCYTCSGSCSGCTQPWQDDCTQTDKRGYCTQWYGCS
jgi:hypothetical protein